MEEVNPIFLAGEQNTDDDDTVGVTNGLPFIFDRTSLVPFDFCCPCFIGFSFATWCQRQILFQLSNTLEKRRQREPDNNRLT